MSKNIKTEDVLKCVVGYELELEEYFSNEDSDSDYKPLETSSEVSVNSDIDFEEVAPAHTIGDKRKTQVAVKSRPSHNWIPPNQFQPLIPPFTPNAGYRVSTNAFSPIDYFQLFVTDDILKHMVTQTNVYANQHFHKYGNRKGDNAWKWTPTDITEMKHFWALTMAMGIVKKPSISLYWSRHPVLQTPLFPAVMNKDRYQILMRFLHFNDNFMDVPCDHPQHDRLFKLRPLIDHFSRCFAEVYTPSQHICVTESIVFCNDRIIFKHSIPHQPLGSGIRLYKLCESSTGYTQSFRIYTGQGTQTDPEIFPENLKKRELIVWDLVHPLVNKGYHLYVDSHYAGIPLFHALYGLGTMACGMIKHNSKGFPQQLVARKQTSGETAALRCKELLAVKYSSKKNVFLLTTIHDENTVSVSDGDKNPPVNKPQCLVDYKKYMLGVVKSDEVLESCDATRKSMVWYKKLAVHLVQLAMYNAYIIYKESTRRTVLSFLDFQASIVSSLLFSNKDQPGRSESDHISRLTERHFMRTLPATGKKEHPQKRCRVCYSKGLRRDTRYYCSCCPTEPSLCLDKCFELYHCVLEYWKEPSLDSPNFILDTK